MFFSDIGLLFGSSIIFYKMLSENGLHQQHVESQTKLMKAEGPEKMLSPKMDQG